MPSKNSMLWEVGRSLLVALCMVVGSSILLASRLEERVKANREQSERDLVAAVAVRRAEQATLARDVEAQRAVLADMAQMLKSIASGQKVTQDAVIRLEERVSYLAQGQDALRIELRSHDTSAGGGKR